MLTKLDIDFNINYYDVLGIDKNILSEDNNIIERQHNSIIIHNAYLKKASFWHPDAEWKGDHPEPSKEEKEQEFIKIVKAHSILSNYNLRSIYNHKKTGSRSISADDLLMNFGKIGCFVKGSLIDEVGTFIFESLCQKIKCEIESTAVPSEEEYDNYIWKINFKNNIIYLSIVQDEREVLRLTSIDHIKDSLPFKIYIFIPSMKAKIITREENDLQIPTGIRYEDIDLYEGTSYDSIIEYIDKQFESDVEKYII